MPVYNSANYFDYYAVVESALTPDEKKENFQIVGESKSANGSLNFLRFRTAIMGVGKRNRNRRLWTKDIMNIMMNSPHIIEYFTKAGGLPGENGHPIPATGQLTMERLVSIDPNNLAVLFKQWWWEGDIMMADAETLDQGEGTPGNRMMKNMIQGMVPSFSARTMVPQRRNADGSIDVTGPGRLATFDRVHGPSCEEAYLDISVPIKNIIKKAGFETAMESFTEYMLEKSEPVKRVLDGLLPAMESATITTDGMLSAKLMATESQNARTLFIPVERNFRNEIASFMTK